MQYSLHIKISFDPTNVSSPGGKVSSEMVIDAIRGSPFEYGSRERKESWGESGAERISDKGILFTVRRVCTRR